MLTLINFLDDLNKENLSKLSFSQKIKYLEEHNIHANMFKEIKSTIRKTDLFIFSPGTQHSSLLPTYLTKNLASNIIANKKILLLLVQHLV